MVYLDAIVVNVRDGAHVINKAAHIAVAVGVAVDVIKHVLGIWIHTAEGAKFLGRGVCRTRQPRRAHRVLRQPHGALPEMIEATSA